jgi:hypothetical protein
MSTSREFGLGIEEEVTYFANEALCLKFRGTSGADNRVYKVGRSTDYGNLEARSKELNLLTRGLKQIETTIVQSTGHTETSNLD